MPRQQKTFTLPLSACPLLSLFFFGKTFCEHTLLQWQEKLFLAFSPFGPIPRKRRDFRGSFSVSVFKASSLSSQTPTTITCSAIVVFFDCSVLCISACTKPNHRRRLQASLSFEVQYVPQTHSTCKCPSTTVAVALTDAIGVCRKPNTSWRTLLWVSKPSHDWGFVNRALAKGFYRGRVIDSRGGLQES